MHSDGKTYSCIFVQMEAASKNLKTNNMKLKGLVTQVIHLLMTVNLILEIDYCVFD